MLIGQDCKPMSEPNIEFSSLRSNQTPNTASPSPLPWGTRVLEAIELLIALALYCSGIVIGKHIPLTGIITGPLMVAPAAKWLNRIRRRHLATAKSIVVEPGQPEVLYLRSFRADAEAEDSDIPEYLTFGFATEEEQFVRALLPIGPTLAIGKPGEALPELGAQRAYYGDAEWQDAVLQAIERCDLALLRVGSTEHLFWEFQQARTRKTPERVVLLVPKDNTEYDVFVARCALARIAMPLRQKRNLKSTLFEGAGSLRGIIYFSADWEPHYVSLKAWQSWGGNPRGRIRMPLYPVFHTGLRPVFEQLNVRWNPLPFNRYLIGLGAIMLLVWGVLALRSISTTPSHGHHPQSVIPLHDSRGVPSHQASRSRFVPPSQFGTDRVSFLDAYQLLGYPIKAA
jgi:hypothetical protein